MFWYFSISALFSISFGAPMTGNDFQNETKSILLPDNETVLEMKIAVRNRNSAMGEVSNILSSPNILNQIVNSVTKATLNKQLINQDRMDLETNGLSSKDGHIYKYHYLNIERFYPHRTKRATTSRSHGRGTTPESFHKKKFGSKLTSSSLPQTSRTGQRVDDDEEDSSSEESDNSKAMDSDESDSSSEDEMDSTSKSSDEDSDNTSSENSDVHFSKRQNGDYINIKGRHSNRVILNRTKGGTVNHNDEMDKSTKQVQGRLNRLEKHEQVEDTSMEKTGSSSESEQLSYSYDISIPTESSSNDDLKSKPRDFDVKEASDDGVEEFKPHKFPNRELNSQANIKYNTLDDYGDNERASNSPSNIYSNENYINRNLFKPDYFNRAELPRAQNLGLYRAVNVGNPLPYDKMAGNMEMARNRGQAMGQSRDYPRMQAAGYDYFGSGIPRRIVGSRQQRFYDYMNRYPYPRYF